MHRVEEKEFLDTFNIILKGLNYSSEDELKKSIQKKEDEIQNMKVNYDEIFKSKVTGINYDEPELEDGVLYEIINKEDVPIIEFTKEEKERIREKTIRKILYEKLNKTRQKGFTRSSHMPPDISEKIGKKAAASTARYGRAILGPAAMGATSGTFIKNTLKENENIKIGYQEGTVFIHTHKKNDTLVSWLESIGIKGKKTISSLPEMIEYLNEQDDVQISPTLFSELKEILNLLKVSKYNPNILSMLESMSRK